MLDLLLDMLMIDPCQNNALCPMNVLRLKPGGDFVLDMMRMENTYWTTCLYLLLLGMLAVVGPMV